MEEQDNRFINFMYSLDDVVPLLLMTILSYSVELNKQLELIGFLVIGSVTVFRILESLKYESETN